MDFRYRRDGEALYAEVPFSLFMAGLRPWFDRLLLIGRLQREPGTMPHRLPGGTELAALPYYEAASSPVALARALPATVRAFARAVRKVDAVLVFGPHPLSVVLVLLTLAMRRRVILGTRQHYSDYIRHRHPDRPALRLAGRLLEGVWQALARALPMIVVGPDLARSFRRSRRLLEVAVSLVRDDDLVTQEQALERDYGGELRVLSVGRLDPEKNPLLLADILAELSGDGGDWRLVVCGDGSQTEELAARAAHLGVDGRAELRGYVPVDGGLRELYRGSHMLLHVSLTEGLPQVLFEAFAAGLPVVATEVGGVGRGPERDAAVLIPPTDAAAAAAALERVASDPALRERLIRRGLELARERTLDAECRRVAGFIRAEAP
jgi:glycosyltransferase involved in cell wall biosynthesis